MSGSEFLCLTAMLCEWRQVFVTPHSLTSSWVAFFMGHLFDIDKLSYLIISSLHFYVFTGYIFKHETSFHQNWDPLQKTIVQYFFIRKRKMKPTHKNIFVSKDSKNKLPQDFSIHVAKFIALTTKVITRESEGAHST